MKITVLTLAFFLTIFSIRADETKPADEVTIQYALASDVFVALQKTFPEIENVVKVIDLRRNCLVLDRDHPDATKIREAIKAIDKRPRQIRLESAVTLIAPDGREKVLTKPTMYTVEGRTVEIWVGEYDGAKLKLTVTPAVVEE